MANAKLQPLYPHESNPLPTVQEAVWAPGPVWTGVENSPQRDVQNRHLIIIIIIIIINKPDIIIRDNEKRACILIDVAVSGDSNVIKKEAEKNFKI